MKILLFEDNPQYASFHLATLQRALNGTGEAIEFKVPPREKATARYDRLIEQDIRSGGHSDATLIVADSDLSGLPEYGGLTEQVVRTAADRLAIPECAYARGESVASDASEPLEWREQRITVPVGNAELFAAQVLSVARGFAAIRERLPVVRRAQGRRSPGKVLAEVLGKPEYADKVALYASGDQNRLESALRTRGSGDIDLNRQVSCLLGYWLWDSVLRYPGVVVNATAAASYLDIAEADFAAPDVAALFAEAIYAGPFANAQGPLWWRGMLDDIVADSDFQSAAALAEGRLSRPVGRSRCCEDPSRSAGYYCMLSRQPVSLANSKPGLTWFPRGADLARISNSKYEEYVPWL